MSDWNGFVKLPRDKVGDALDAFHDKYEEVCIHVDTLIEQAVADFEPPWYLRWYYKNNEDRVRVDCLRTAEFWDTKADQLFTYGYLTDEQRKLYNKMLDCKYQYRELHALHSSGAEDIWVKHHLVTFINFCHEAKVS